MFVVNNEGLDDNYNDKHTYLTLSAESFTLFVFNNPAGVTLLKKNPRGGQNYESMPEIAISPGSLTVQGAVGIKLRNAVAGSQSRIILTVPEFDKDSPDPVLIGYTPTTAKISASGGVSSAPSVPIGAVIAWLANSVPAQYLICDGSAISRTTYSDLFAVIGTTYGVGDGSTTFNIPDLRARVIVGKGTNAANNTLGQNDGIAIANRRQQHRHTVNEGSGHQHGANGGNGAGGGLIQVVSNVGGSGTTALATTGLSVGAATDTLDTPSYMVLNWVISTGV